MTFKLTLISWFWICFVQTSRTQIGSLLFLNTAGANISTTQYKKAMSRASELNQRFVLFVNTTTNRNNNTKCVVQSTRNPSIKLKVRAEYLSLRPVILLYDVSSFTAQDLFSKLKRNQNDGITKVNALQSLDLESIIAQVAIEDYYPSVYRRGGTLHVIISAANGTSVDLWSLKQKVNELLQSTNADHQIGVATADIYRPSTKTLYVHYINNEVRLTNAQHHFMVLGRSQRLYSILAQNTSNNMIYSQFADYLYHAQLSPNGFINADPKWMEPIYKAIKKKCN
eukprot:16315_1